MEDGSAPATKQDIEELRLATKQDIEELRSEMSRQYDDLVERIVRWETKLTEAFNGFAEINNARLIELEAERRGATQPSRYS